MRTAHTLQTGFVGLQVGCVPKGTHAVAGYGLLPNPQAARHAQVNQQHACVKTNQQVFGAAAAFAHHQPAQGGFYFGEFGHGGGIRYVFLRDGIIKLKNCFKALYVFWHNYLLIDLQTAILVQV